MDGLLVGALLIRPPLVVFALGDVLIALAAVNPFLIELPGVLLAVLGQLSAPMRPTLVLELPLVAAFGTPLFPAHPAGVGVGACLLVIEVALFAVAAELVPVEIGLVPVERLLLFFAVANFAHDFAFPGKLTGQYPS